MFRNCEALGNSKRNMSIWTIYIPEEMNSKRLISSFRANLIPGPWMDGVGANPHQM